jgi:hypothetical protein
MGVIRTDIIKVFDLTSIRNHPVNLQQISAVPLIAVPLHQALSDITLFHRHQAIPPETMTLMDCDHPIRNHHPGAQTLIIGQSPIGPSAEATR